MKARTTTTDFDVLVWVKDKRKKESIEFDLVCRHEAMRGLGNLTPEEAREIARMLLAVADAAER